MAVTYIKLFNYQNKPVKSELLSPEVGTEAGQEEKICSKTQDSQLTEPVIQIPSGLLNF